MHTPRPKTFQRLGRQGLVALGAVLLVAQTAAAVRAAEPKSATVRLVVDYGDGSEVHFTALPWREGMTALDALSAAKTHPHGISFSQAAGRAARQ